MYVIIKNSEGNTERIINMDNIADVAVVEDNNGTRLEFDYNHCLGSRVVTFTCDFATYEQALERLLEIQDSIKKKKRYVELDCSYE